MTVLNTSMNTINQGHLGHLEVKLVSRPVMVNKVIRIKDSRGQ
jgi:hypothetical protein